MELRGFRGIRGCLNCGKTNAYYEVEERVGEKKKYCLGGYRGVEVKSI